MSIRRGKVFEWLNTGNSQPQFTFYIRCHILYFTWFLRQLHGINRVYFYCPHLTDVESEALRWTASLKACCTKPSILNSRATAVLNSRAMFLEGTKDSGEKCYPAWAWRGSFQIYVFSKKEEGVFTLSSSLFTISVRHFAFMLMILGNALKWFENNVKL